MKGIGKLVSASFLLFSLAIALPAAWTTKRLTSNTGQSSFPAVAARGDYVYTVWTDDVAGNDEIYFKRSTDNGDSWLATKRLTNNAEASDRPALAVFKSKVYVIW